MHSTQDEPRVGIAFWEQLVSPLLACLRSGKIRYWPREEAIKYTCYGAVLEHERFVISEHVHNFWLRAIIGKFSQFLELRIFKF